MICEIFVITSSNHKEVIMQKRFITLSFIFIFCLSFFFVGCVATLKNYKPKSSNEEAIKTLLLRWETTWNKRDAQGNLALWHDDAKIMYGRERKIASKKEYADMLPKRMAGHPTIKLRAPKIDIKEDKAVVKVTIDFGRHQSATTFYLVCENNKWFIMSLKY